MKEEGKKNILRWNRHKGSQTHCNGEAMVVNTDIETMYINIRVQYCTCRVPVVISVIILNRNVLVCVKGSKGDVCQAECRFKCSDRGSVEHCRLAVISFHEIIQDVEVEISTRGMRHAGRLCRTICAGQLADAGTVRIRHEIFLVVRCNILGRLV